MLVKEYSSESGHFYSPNGDTAYRIVGKNGKERNTTVKDARELGLLPSVTTIIGCAAKPALDVWKQQQAILAALTLPRIAVAQNGRLWCLLRLGHRLVTQGCKRPRKTLL